MPRVFVQRQKKWHRQIFLLTLFAMTELNSGEAAARKAIQILGGPVKAALVLKVKGGRHQTVQSWLKNRVPAEHCPAIEQATAGAVRCEDMRPDVPWGVLRTCTHCTTTPPPETRDAA